jgi:exoribonuclease R
MPTVRHHNSATELNERFAAIRASLNIAAETPPAARAEAEERVRNGPIDLPGTREDLTEIPFWSVDPTGSRDLDQAIHLERRGSGYLFRYAIADLAAWVIPDGAIDLHAHQQGLTLYCPDTSVPLHPVALSHGAASLLEGQEAPALVWELQCDQHATVTEVGIRRALIRNHHATDYTALQRELEQPKRSEQTALFEEFATLRQELEQARGAVSLSTPEQEIRKVGDTYELVFEGSLRAEDLNAQLSLCVGMTAAALMVKSGHGVLRTLPSPSEVAMDRLRTIAASLGVPFAESMTYRSWLASLPTGSPVTAAAQAAASRTLRGAAYALINDSDGIPPTHWAIGAPYAHVTAPLRRLVDRYASEICLAAVQNTAIPEWVEASLEKLPREMDRAARLSTTLEGKNLDLMEAAALLHRNGNRLRVTVLSSEHGHSTCQIVEPAVVISVNAALTPGTIAEIRLTAVEIDPPTIKAEPWDESPLHL